MKNSKRKAVHIQYDIISLFFYSFITRIHILCSFSFHVPLYIFPTIQNSFFTFHILFTLHVYYFHSLSFKHFFLGNFLCGYVEFVTDCNTFVSLLLQCV